jgi:hypothetical protein
MCDPRAHVGPGLAAASTPSARWALHELHQLYRRFRPILIDTVAAADIVNKWFKR